MNCGNCSFYVGRLFARTLFLGVRRTSTAAGHHDSSEYTWPFALSASSDVSLTDKRNCSMHGRWFAQTSSALIRCPTVSAAGVQCTSKICNKKSPPSTEERQPAELPRYTNVSQSQLLHVRSAQVSCCTCVIFNNLQTPSYTATFNDSSHKTRDQRYMDA